MVSALPRAAGRQASPAAGRSPVRTKTSSSVARIGLIDTSRAPPSRSDAARRSGSASGPQLDDAPAVGNRHSRARHRAPDSTGDAGSSPDITSSQPVTLNATMSARRRPTTQLAADQDADAAAQRLGVREDVRTEEHRAAAVAQFEDERPHVAAAQRVEPGHRFVEEDDLGIVDERLRQAHALQHALRVLAQRQPPFAAEADPIEQPRDARRAFGSRVPEQAGEVAEQFFRASGSRRNTAPRAGSRCGAGVRRRPATGPGWRCVRTSDRSAA